MNKFNFKICFQCLLWFSNRMYINTFSTQQLDMGCWTKRIFTKVVSEVEKDDSSQSEMWYWLNLARMYQVQNSTKKIYRGF